MQVSTIEELLQYDETKKRLIVVLGMHRSGTSTITRGLQVLGVELGDKLLPPVPEDNAKGYFEDADFNSLNIEILQVLGSDWHCLSPIEQSDVELLHQQGYFLRAVDLLRQKTTHASIFGLKDPRVAKLLPFWQSVFVYCSFDISYVLAIRNPLSVVKSLEKRADFSNTKSYLLWLGHILTSLEHTKLHRRVLIDYDQFLDAPESSLEYIAKQFFLHVNTQALEEYQLEFLDKSLRHTVYTVDDLALDQACPPLVQETYAALSKIAQDNNKLSQTEFQENSQIWIYEFERFKSSLKWMDQLSTELNRVRQIAEIRQAELVEFTGKLNDVQQAREQQTNEQAEREQALATQLTQARHQLEAQLRELNEREKAFAEQLQTIQQAHAQQTNEQRHEQAERERTLNTQLFVKQGELYQLTQNWLDAEQVQTKTLNQLSYQLSTIHNSFSWRWTAPLRNLVRLLGKAGADSVEDKNGVIPSPPLVLSMSKDEQHISDLIHQNEIQTITLNVPLHKDSSANLYTTQNADFLNMTTMQTSLIANSIEELLSYHDEEFVYCAYHTLLGRAPDPEGLRYYLARVRCGISKVEILAQLRLSVEGKSQKVTTKGLDEAIKRHKLFKTPLLGTLLRQTSVKQPEASIQQSIRAIENKLYAQDMNIQHHFSKMDGALRQLSQLINNKAPLTGIKSSNIVCIIPYYNGSKFIERALISIFNQTVPADEIIVVNDGSRAEEREFLCELTKRYSFKIIHKTNGGQGSARNAGVSASNSKYICLLDQDDFYLPRHNEILLNGIPIDDPDFGWVYADLLEANGDGSIMRTSMVKEHSIHPKQSVIHMIGNDMFVLPSASLINRKAYESVGGFDEQFTGYEDDDLFLRLFSKGWGNIFIDKAVTTWCIHSESTSYSVKMSRSRFRYLKKLVNLFPDDPTKARFYFRDLMMPRFGPLIIADAIKAEADKSQDSIELFDILGQYYNLVCSAKGVPENLIFDIKNILDRSLASG